MRWCLAIAAAATLVGCGGPDEGAGPRERPDASAPNVVVIQTDDQDAATLEVMSAVRRRLAGRGTTFTNYHVTTPECCPSRATLLTGQYAHNHGVAGNERPDGGFAALDGSETLPVWLQRAGYVTAHFGRYLNGYGDPAQDSDPREVPEGWDTWATPITPTDHEMYGYEMNEDGRLVRYGDAPEDYETDVIAADAVDFIERASHRPRPFFLSVDTLAPHDEGSLEGTGAPRNPRPAPRDLGAFAGRPLPRPPSFDEAAIGDKPAFLRRPPLTGKRIRGLTRLYRSRLESLLAVDDLVRDVVRSLARTGELAKTLIVFTSDNGYLLGEHRLGGKLLPYEEATRVPLVIRGPGVPAGARRSQLVANIDLAPTILAAAGAEPGLQMDGRSLEPLFRDPAAGIHRAIGIEASEGEPYVAIRTPRFVFVRYRRGGSELYDLRGDPYELRNRTDDPELRQVRRRLRERLAALRDCSGSGCP